jgi:hypothetical protein
MQHNDAEMIESRWRNMIDESIRAGFRRFEFQAFVGCRIQRELRRCCVLFTRRAFFANHANQPDLKSPHVR